MNAFAFLNLLAAGIHLSLGVAVLRIDRRSAAHRLLFLICLSFGWWGLCYAFMHAAPTADVYWTWYRVSTPAWVLCPALILHLLLALDDTRPTRWRTVRDVLVYLPALLFLIRSVSGPLFAAAVSRGSFGWVERPGDGAWPLAFVAYFVGYLLLGMWRTLLRRRHTELASTRQQALDLLLASALSLALITTTEVVLPWLGHPLPVLTPVIGVLWVGGIWYGIARHGLMRLSLASAADAILATMSDAVVLVAPDGKIVRTNRATQDMLGWDESELAGRPWSSLLAEQRASDETKLQRFLAAGPVPHFETVGRRKSGESIPLFLSAGTIHDRYGIRRGEVLVLRDASDLRRTEERLHHLAHHDALTGLPNRLLFRDRLEHSLHRARRLGEPLGVMVIDLDRFKEVNDTLGHEAGDTVLKVVAQRLAACIRRSDTVARLGGDEFAVSLPDLKKPDDVRVVAERILGSLARPVDLLDRPQPIPASIGISLRPEHGDDADTLLRHADTAMYRAKATGRGGSLLFDPAWGDAAVEPHESPERLRQALERHEFVLYFQPQVAMADGRLVGVEALLRWDHPERGMLLPMTFLPQAAESDVILDLCGWVLRTATAQARAWDTAGLPPVLLAVNLCARQLMMPELPDRLREVLDQTGFPAERLELELTEDAMARDDRDVLHTVKRLHAIGAGIAIDDFGAGPTSVTFLARFPIRTVKLGQSLVRGLPEDRDHAAIARAVVSMTRALHIERVVAEGVETEAQLAFLRTLGCDTVQGNLTGAATTAQDIARRLSEG